MSSREGIAPARVACSFSFCFVAGGSIVALPSAPVVTPPTETPAAGVRLPAVSYSATLTVNGSPPLTFAGACSSSSAGGGLLKSSIRYQRMSSRFLTTV